MKLTPFAKLFITLVILAVVGYTAWHFEGSEIRKWAGAEQSASQTQPAVSAGDFDALKNAPPDPSRGAGSTGVSGSTLAGTGKLKRPLVEGINTWAGHSPGIALNNGLEPPTGPGYKRQYGPGETFAVLAAHAAQQ